MKTPLKKNRKDRDYSAAEAYEAFNFIIDILQSDLDRCSDECIKAREKEDVQFWRRALVRAVFSLMEGVVHRMKQIALAYYKKRRVNFSASEIMILSDKSYELDRQGKIAEKRLKASLTGNIRLAFSMFARVHHSTYDLRVDNAAWEAFLKSIEVRDRLMHPKEYVPRIWRGLA